jgi:PleD family two-component response regulator
MGTATIIPGRETTPETIIEIADQALYRAKNEGRDRVVTTPFINTL